MRSFLVFVFVLCCSLGANAEIIKAPTGMGCALVKETSIENLKTKSGIIFKGKLKNISLVEENGLRVRKLQFDVLDNIKGAENSSITISEWAETKTPFVSKRVTKGKPYVFFFYPPSTKGLTSLVGMEQGLVDISPREKLLFSKRLRMNNSKPSKFLFIKTKTKHQFSSYEDLKKFCIS